MGSCISKCKPNRKKPVKHEEDDLNLQQDKPIIAVSETQINPPPPLKSPLLLPPHKTLNPNLLLSPISPSNSSSSSSSSSSFSCTTNHHNSSSSSSSSSSTASSSILLTKHKSFKQNPQITLLDPTKKPTSAPPPPPHKRQRASSPNLTRQKSFRRDPTLLSHHANKSSPLRSPSPSRRFVTHKEAMDNLKTSTNISKAKTFNNVKKGFNSDPNSRSRRSFRSSPSMRKEAEICNLNRVVSRVNGITIGEERSLKCMQDVEMLPLEDLNNPHIALDCFIFL